jgi:hypothetical protein
LLDNSRGEFWVTDPDALLPWAACTSLRGSLVLYGPQFHDDVFRNRSVSLRTNVTHLDGSMRIARTGFTTLAFVAHELFPRLTTISGNLVVDSNPALLAVESSSWPHLASVDGDLAFVNCSNLARIELQITSVLGIVRTVSVPALEFLRFPNLTQAGGLQVRCGLYCFVRRLLIVTVAQQSIHPVSFRLAYFPHLETLAEGSVDLSLQLTSDFEQQRGRVAVYAPVLLESGAVTVSLGPALAVFWLPLLYSVSGSLQLSLSGTAITALRVNLPFASLSGRSNMRFCSDTDSAHTCWDTHPLHEVSVPHAVHLADVISADDYPESQVTLRGASGVTHFIGSVRLNLSSDDPVHLTEATQFAVRILGDLGLGFANAELWRRNLFAWLERVDGDVGILALSSQNIPGLYALTYVGGRFSVIGAAANVSVSEVRRGDVECQ